MAVRINARPWETRMLGLLGDGPQTRDALLLEGSEFVPAHVALNYVAIDRTHQGAELGGRTTRRGGTVRQGQEEVGKRLVASQALSFMVREGLIHSNDGETFAVTVAGKEHQQNPPSQAAAYLTSDMLAGILNTASTTPLDETLCCYCQRPVDPNVVGTWKKVVGWEQKRKSGGANKIAAKENLRIYAHEDCLPL